jgi:Protein of unknown function (DUF1759)
MTHPKGNDGASHAHDANAPQQDIATIIMRRNTCFTIVESFIKAMPAKQDALQLDRNTQKLKSFGKSYQRVVDELKTCKTVDWNEQMTHQAEFETMIEEAECKLFQLQQQMESQITIAAMEDIVDEITNLQIKAEQVEGGFTPAAAAEAYATLPEQLKIYEDLYQSSLRGSDEARQAEMRKNRKAFRESHFSASALIRALVDSQQRATRRPSDGSQSSNESRMTARIKLPTIALPSFNGNAEEWVSFRDTFISMVHENPDLSGSTKFRYLKSSITDKLSPIAFMPESTEGYEDAWETVKRFYENKRKTWTNILPRFST